MLHRTVTVTDEEGRAMQAKEHWEKVYTGKAVTEVSWFQAHAELSLKLIRDAAVALGQA